MNEYEWVRMRGEEMIREAELARLAAEGRRSARAAGRSRPARSLMQAVVRLWTGRRTVGAESARGLRSASAGL